jgi:hypothetical protein
MQVSKHAFFFFWHTVLPCGCACTASVEMLCYFLISTTLHPHAYTDAILGALDNAVEVWGYLSPETKIATVETCVDILNNMDEGERVALLTKCVEEADWRFALGCDTRELSNDDATLLMVRHDGPNAVSRTERVATDLLADLKPRLVSDSCCSPVWTVSSSCLLFTVNKMLERTPWIMPVLLGEVRGRQWVRDARRPPS